MKFSILHHSRALLVLGGAIFAAAFGCHLSAAAPQIQNVRMAELEIDPTQIEAYTTALREEISTSIRLEPGVLALHAVAEKGDPAHIRILEIYASEAAYRLHIETPHFKKYKVSTAQMVKSLKLIEVIPVLLASKPN